MKPVYAAGGWTSNAALIAAANELYPLTGTVIDATYGKGNFWKTIRPHGLIAHDIRTDGIDFRQLPEASGSASTVVLDPPYVAPGGRKTSTLNGMNHAFGMHTTEPTPERQWKVILDGCTEAWRVLERDGMLWLKAMDYIWSGRMQWVTAWIHRDLPALGYELVDRFIYVNSGGPQPSTNPDGSPRRQVHARNNTSTLFIARKAGTSELLAHLEQAAA